MAKFRHVKNNYSVLFLVMILLSACSDRAEENKSSVDPKPEPLVASTEVSAGGNIAAGQARAMVCRACHGPAGISSNDLWPNLAGQKKDYLVKQLKDFRAGIREDAMMAPMVRDLTDEHIADLGAYYSSLPE